VRMVCLATCAFVATFLCVGIPGPDPEYNNLTSRLKILGLIAPRSLVAYLEDDLAQVEIGFHASMRVAHFRESKDAIHDWPQVTRFEQRQAIANETPRHGNLVANLT
jgi:hypothetical protein